MGSQLVVPRLEHVHTGNTNTRWTRQRASPRQVWRSSMRTRPRRWRDLFHLESRIGCWERNHVNRALGWTGFWQIWRKDTPGWRDRWIREQEKQREGWFWDSQECALCVIWPDERMQGGRHTAVSQPAKTDLHPHQHHLPLGLCNYLHFGSL